MKRIVSVVALAATLAGAVAAADNSPVSAFAIQSQTGAQVSLSFLDSARVAPTLVVTVQRYTAGQLVGAETLGAALTPDGADWLGVAGPFTVPIGSSYYATVHKPNSTKPLAIFSFTEP